MKKLTMLFLTLALVFLISSCGGNGSILQGGRASALTREEAENVAVEYIQQISEMYILHNGHNIRQTDWGRMENNGYMFVYEYDVDSDSLPETVTKIEVTLEVINGKAQNAVSEGVYS